MQKKSEKFTKVKVLGFAENLKISRQQSSEKLRLWLGWATIQDFWLVSGFPPTTFKKQKARNKGSCKNTALRQTVQSQHF